MQTASPAMEQAPIVTLSSGKHLQLGGNSPSVYYQPIGLYGSTSSETSSAAISNLPKLTTTFSIIPGTPDSPASPPAFPSATTSDPLPLLLSSRDSITPSPSSTSSSAEPVVSFSSDSNSLDSYSSKSTLSSSTNSNHHQSSFKSKFLNTFTKTKRNSKKKIQVSSSASGEDGTHTNPMFDYENLDQAEDVHQEELTTPVPTPEPPKVQEMFDINLDEREHDHQHQHHHGSEHEHQHGHGHSHSADNKDVHAHGHTHAHSNGHAHHYTQHCHDRSLDMQLQAQTRRAMFKLILGLVLCLIFMIIELVGGYLSESLAIFTDAAHLTSDLVSFAISLASIFLGQRRPTKSKSFGYYRFEVLGVLVSVFTIWFITGLLIYLAFHRIIHQDFELHSETMLIVSSIGLGMNLLMMFVLADGLSHCWDAFLGVCLRRKGRRRVSHEKLGQSEAEEGGVVKKEGSHSHGHGHSHGFAGHGHSHMNMNVRAALLHIVGDIIQSIGVLIAAILIHLFPHLKLADPICTLIFGVIVFLTTYQILSDALHILMEGFPRDLALDYESVRSMLLDRLRPEGVVHVHSLHVWSLTHGRNCLTVHLTVDRQKASLGADECFDRIRQHTQQIARTELSIGQCTIQVEWHDPLAVESCDTCIGPRK